MTVTVRDDGVGIDNSPPTQGGGLGLLLLRNQSQHALIKSDEAGTVVKLRFSV